MNLLIITSFIVTTVALDLFSQRPVQAQSLQTINIATAAAGQSGYKRAMGKISLPLGWDGVLNGFCLNLPRNYCAVGCR
jgi:hypothetical protein